MWSSTGHRQSATSAPEIRLAGCGRFPSSGRCGLECSQHVVVIHRYPRTDSGPLHRARAQSAGNPARTAIFRVFEREIFWSGILSPRPTFSWKINILTHPSMQDGCGVFRVFGAPVTIRSHGAEKGGRPKGARPFGQHHFSHPATVARPSPVRTDRAAAAPHVRVDPIGRRPAQ